MFGYLFAALIFAVLLIDRVFLPKSARRAWTVMAFVMGSGAIVALAPGVLEAVTSRLGVGRPVDLVLYLTTVLLLREVFLSRARSARTLMAITRVTRSQALQAATRIS
jgi:hypothetical protein